MIIFKSKRLNLAENILNYQFSLSGEYLNNKYVMKFIKSHTYDERLNYVINICNKKKPSKREQFLLAIAYYLKGTLYNDYAIYYINAYLEDNKFYNRYFSHCYTREAQLTYQSNLFHYMVAVKYMENLEYDNALNHALMSKGLNDNSFRKFESYSLISEILYKQGKINDSIQNLYEGIKKTANEYEKSRYIQQLQKYEEYKSKGILYKSKNIKRPRIDIKTNTIYNLTTGEIINK